MSKKEDQQMDFVDAMASRDNRSNRTARFLGKLPDFLNKAESYRVQGRRLLQLNLESRTSNIEHRT